MVSLPSPVVLSEEQIAFFHDQGYLVANDVMPVDELQPVIDELTTEINKRARQLVADGDLSQTYEEENFQTQLAKISQETDKLALSIWNSLLHGNAIFHTSKRVNVFGVIRTCAISALRITHMERCREVWN